MQRFQNEREALRSSWREVKVSGVGFVKFDQGFASLSVLGVDDYQLFCLVNPRKRVLTTRSHVNLGV